MGIVEINNTCGKGIISFNILAEGFNNFCRSGVEIEIEAGFI